MKLTSEQFLQLPNKCITLLGMSGVGKTTLAAKLSDNWYHYSGDYRIGTRYLRKSILDDIRRRSLEVPFLRDLFRTNSIRIGIHITKDNLTPVTNFLGKIGNIEYGGLPLKEFKRRQTMHRQAEIAAMNDVPKFIQRSRDINGVHHFLNDAGGSICELECPGVIRVLAANTVIVYIQTSDEMEQTLIDRALKRPKPMYYRETFLEDKLSDFMTARGYLDTDQIVPDEFMQWVFPKLFHSRIPRYQALANEYGYTVQAADIAQVNGEEDFIQLVAEAIARRRS